MTDNLSSTLQSFRHMLHRDYAERSTMEYRTAAAIRAYLEAHSQAEITQVGNTGTIAVYKGKLPGKTILLRADIDALPIQETNTFDHRSADPEVSHKCGHDGHTAIMLGVMHLLEAQPLDKGTIILLWQPAEENGMGAKAVIADPHFQQYQIDEVYALHNLPGYPLHQILYKNGAFSANVKSLIIDLEGKTAHAAEPEHGYNPAYTIAKILDFAQGLIHNVPTDDHFYLITPVYMQVGSQDYGIAAGSGTLHLTIRSWSPAIFEAQTQKLQDYIATLCAIHHITPQFSWTQEFWSNQNDPAVVATIQQSAAELGLDHHTLQAPFKWGEDFGLFTQTIPGAMFGIGSGEDCPALHNPDYDYPDEITLTAAQLFYKILENAL